MDEDRGSATVLGVGALAVLVLLITFGVHLGEVVVRRHEASGAADLAALAAAAHLLDGEASACDRARWVAERMGTSLVGCSVLGWEVTVEVTGVPTVFGATNVSARAGPTEE